MSSKQRWEERHQDSHQDSGDRPGGDIVNHHREGRVGVFPDLFDPRDRPRFEGVEDPEDDEDRDEWPDRGRTQRPDDQGRPEHTGDLIKIALVVIAFHFFARVAPAWAPLGEHQRLTVPDCPGTHRSGDQDRKQENRETSTPRRLPQKPQEEASDERTHQSTALALEAGVNQAGDEAGEEGGREE